MPSEVEIASAALVKVGEDVLTSFEDGSKGALLANATFAIHRDSLMRSHEWNFAVERTSLAASSTEPEWEFTYAYPVPGDCLKILTIDNPSDYDWRVEGNAILTDLGAPLYVRYLKRVTDTNKWDTLFIETLIAKLASEWSESLTKDADLRADLLKEYRGKLDESAGVDGQEGKPEPLPDGSWLEAHN